MTGLIMYDLLIFANCMFSLQGFIMAMVYFVIQRMDRPKIDCLQNTPPCPSFMNEVTVSDIRYNAKRKAEIDHLQEQATGVYLEERSDFHIFDGTPDVDSPWAKYIDCSDYSSDEDKEDVPGHLDAPENVDKETLEDLHEETPDNLDEETPGDLHEDTPGDLNKDRGV
eukprot:725845_1